MSDRSDLPEFLLARFAEDETEARHWTCDCAIEGFPLQHGLRCEQRVKAECDAKRRILQWFTYETDVRVTVRKGVYKYVPVRKVSLDDGEVLALLALPYAAHPDYRDEWRP